MKPAAVNLNGGMFVMDALLMSDEAPQPQNRQILLLRNPAVSYFPEPGEYTERIHQSEWPGGQTRGPAAVRSRTG